MSKKALQIEQEKLAHLQEELAIASNAAQKFELKKQIEQCQQRIQQLETPQPISNSELRKNKPINPILLVLGVGIAVFLGLPLVGVIIKTLGGHNPSSAPVSNQGTTSSEPNQGTTSEPQTKSEQNSETGLKKWCLDMKQQAERTGGSEYINDVKKQMESQKCSSLGVSLP